MNAGVRAVANLPKYGHFNLTEIRTHLGIQSVVQIKEKVILQAAWKRRDQYQELNQSLSGPSTRSRAKGNVPHPIRKGPLNKMISTSLSCGWNRLPITIKFEEDAKKAKRMIAEFVCKLS